MTDSIEALRPQVDEQELAKRLVEQAPADGVELIGPGGLLTGLTSRVINTALDAERLSTSAMTSTTRPAVTAAPRATIRARRRC